MIAGGMATSELIIGSIDFPLTLPPKFPALNPVENVWQFMRDNWLSNRVFDSYDNLVDHRCQAKTGWSICLGILCPSHCETGDSGPDQRDLA